MCFAKFSDHTTPLFHKIKFTKYFYLVSIENCSFIKKYFFFFYNFYSIFNHLYALVNGRHNHQTRFTLLAAIPPNLAEKSFYYPQSPLRRILFKIFFPKRVSNKPQNVFKKLFTLIIYSRNIFYYHSFNYNLTLYTLIFRK